MKRLMRTFWSDDNGAIIATEYLFIITILIIGVVVGLTALREAINHELVEAGNAMLALSQGFTISGSSGAEGSVDGSAAIDTPGSLTDPVLTPPAFPALIDTVPCD